MVKYYQLSLPQQNNENRTYQTGNNEIFPDKIMKKERAGVYLLEGSVWPYDIVVCLGASREDIISYFKKRFKDGLTESDKTNIVMTGNGRTIKLDNRAFILWLKKFPKDSKDFGFLAHEIFHTADLILRSAGVGLTDESDETFAYFIDWITKNIHQAFKL